ncbi:helix-turn-helix domain-containing protein, partial [Streptococcus sp. DD13]|uniref:helix-turn-helix domain-containing protein n=1 Tax=Streptococcus sp. DD13 TaxID=1777881 RepID=UPI00082B5326
MNTDHYLSKYIANKVKHLRKQEKMSQEDLSEKAGLGLKYVNQLENQHVNLTLTTLEKVITALDLTPEEFFNFSSLEAPAVPRENPALRRFTMKVKQLPAEKQATI